MCLYFYSLWSVSVMISSLNDNSKPLLNNVGSLSLAKSATCATEMTGLTIHHKFQFSTQFWLLVLIETDNI